MDFVTHCVAMKKIKGRGEELSKGPGITYTIELRLSHATHVVTNLSGLSTRNTNKSSKDRTWSAVPHALLGVLR